MDTDKTQPIMQPSRVRHTWYALRTYSRGKVRARFQVECANKSDLTYYSIISQGKVHGSRQRIW
jgi:hypothetical protein